MTVPNSQRLANVVRFGETGPYLRNNAGVLETSNDGASWGHVSENVRKVTVTVTDAQIKALGTGADKVTLIEGIEGAAIFPILGCYVTDTRAGIYRNFGTNPGMGIYTRSGAILAGVCAPVAETASDNLSALLGVADELFFSIVPFTTTPALYAPNAPIPFAKSAIAGSDIVLQGYNDEGTPWEDGNPANSMKIILWYGVIEL